MKDRIIKLLTVVFGNMLYALSVVLFLEPSGMITGGTTGIALAANHYFGFSVSLVLLITNVAMLLAGWKILGFEFAMTTVLSTFFVPGFIEVCERLLAGVVLTTDPMLNMVFCGIGIGVALGLVFRVGASTGGMDIPPLVLYKWFKIPVAISMWALDIFVLILQMPGVPMNLILYSILLVVVYSILIDKVILLGATKTQLTVVSEQIDLIREAIITKVDRGVTLLHAEGGFLRDEKKIVLSVIANRELAKVEQLIHDIDPEAFIIINRVNEVKGKGFSSAKYYYDGIPENNDRAK